MKTKRIAQFISLVLVMVMVCSVSAGAALDPVEPEAALTDNALGIRTLSAMEGEQEADSHSFGDKR